MQKNKMERYGGNKKKWNELTSLHALSDMDLDLVSDVMFSIYNGLEISTKFPLYKCFLIIQSQFLHFLFAVTSDVDAM